MNSETASPLRHCRPAWILLLGLAFVFGCGGSPTLSEYGYEVAQTISNVARRERSDQIAPLRELIDEGKESGKLREDEAAHFHEIVDQLEAGEWIEAREQATDLLADQVRD